MEKYRGLSPAEFFHRNREMAGFSNPVRALYQTVRELVENALDATETHGILPEIKVEIALDEERDNWVHVTVADNGIGIPLTEVPNVFGRVFYGSKYVIRQTRGTFGLGGKMAVLHAQITTARPIYVKSSTLDARVSYEYRLYIDIGKNIPHIIGFRVRRKGRSKWHGTIVSLVTEGAWSQARRRIDEYIRRTALIAPYATIIYRTPEGEVVYERASDKLPEPPQVGKHHPRGVDIEILKNMIRSLDEDIPLKDFLRRYFESVGEKSAVEFLRWAGFDPETPIKSLGIRDLERLANAMKRYGKWRRPRPITLSPLGKDLLEQGARRILDPEFVAAVTRPPASYGGHPFIVEAAVAYGGKIEPQNSPLLLRFANRMPLLYDEGADVARKIVDSIDWSVYKVKFPAPLAVITHVCSTKLPFKSVGKEAIADVPEVEKELEIAIREVSRKLRQHLSRMERLHEVKRKEITIRKYIPEVSRSLSYVSGVEEATLKRKLEEMLEREIKKRGVVADAPLPKAA